MPVLDQGFGKVIKMPGQEPLDETLQQKAADKLLKALKGRKLKRIMSGRTDDGGKVLILDFSQKFRVVFAPGTEFQIECPAGGIRYQLHRGQASSER